MATKGPYAEIAAAGTTQAAATLATADTMMITSGTSGAGIRLDDMDLNAEVIIVNGVSTSEYLIYPKVGGKINNATANLPLGLPPQKASRFRAINALDVIAFF